MRKIKVLIETKEKFLRELDKELNEIEKGKKRTFDEDTISFQSKSQLRKFMTNKQNNF